MTKWIDRFRSWFWCQFNNNEEKASFWWLWLVRTPMHAIVGSFFAAIGWLLIWGSFPKVPIQITFTICWGFLVILKEIQEDEHQAWYKTWADVLSMLGGFTLTMWWPEIAA